MGNSFILIVVGLLLFYLVISNKWNCFEGFLACVVGKTNNSVGAPLIQTPSKYLDPNNYLDPATLNVNNQTGAFGQNFFSYGF